METMFNYLMSRTTETTSNVRRLTSHMKYQDRRIARTHLGLIVLGGFCWSLIGDVKSYKKEIQELKKEMSEIQLDLDELSEKITD